MILPDQDLSTARILVIDDNPTNVALLADILDDAGFDHVDTQTDPRRGIERFLAVRHDLILLDIRMPQIDGFGVMRILQEKLTPGDYLPVIILTAHADPATRKKALDSGARDFVSKPFDARDLIKRMRKQLDARAQHNRTFKAQRPAARR